MAKKIGYHLWTAQNLNYLFELVEAAKEDFPNSTTSILYKRRALVNL